MKLHRMLIVAGMASLLLARDAAASLVVTPSSSAATLSAAALSGGGITITSSSVSNLTLGNGSSSTGTYVVSPVGSGPYAINGMGVVLSTGDVRDYAGPAPNTVQGRSTNFRTGAQGNFVDFGGTVPSALGVTATAGQLALLNPITGTLRPRTDVTQLDINFTLAANRNAVAFDLIFGSDEYPQYVNQGYQDGFGIYVNGQNIAQVNGIPVTIDSPYMTATGGTELNGILTTGLVHFDKIVGFGASGTLTLILGDVGDGIFDTTVYLQGLGGAVVPEPGSFALAAMLFGVGGVFALRRNRR